jgi:bloom syndrome protein
VTDHAKALVRLIRDLSKERNNITILYIADIYKGSNIKKIRDFGIY